MAYEKHTWSCGETVTAELLNNMEDGIAEGGGTNEPLVISVESSDECKGMIFNVTMQELRDAVQQNRPIYIDDGLDSSFMLAISGQYEYENGNIKATAIYVMPYGSDYQLSSFTAFATAWNEKMHSQICIE